MPATSREPQAGGPPEPELLSALPGEPLRSAQGPAHGSGSSDGPSALRFSWCANTSPQVYVSPCRPSPRWAPPTFSRDLEMPHGPHSRHPVCQTPVPAPRASVQVPLKDGGSTTAASGPQLSPASVSATVAEHPSGWRTRSPCPAPLAQNHAPQLPAVLVPVQRAGGVFCSRTPGHSLAVPLEVPQRSGCVRAQKVWLPPCLGPRHVCLPHWWWSPGRSGPVPAHEPFPGGRARQPLLQLVTCEAELPALPLPQGWEVSCTVGPFSICGYSSVLASILFHFSRHDFLPHLRSSIFP